MAVSLKTHDSTTAECLLVYDNEDGFKVEKSLGGTTANLLLECRWADIRVRQRL